MNSTSLNEIAFNVLNSLRGGRSSNTEHLSLEQVKFAIKHWRAVLIRRDQQRNFNRYRQFEQDLGLVPVSKVDTAESSTENSNNFLFRTDETIPAPIRLKNSEAITFIGGIDKAGRPIPLVDAHRNYWNQFNKYTAEEPEAYYRNGYVYVDNTNYIEDINIRGIFEDPEEVHEFTKENGLDLYDDDSPFPIPMDMLQQITSGLLNGELKLAVTTKNDTEADTLQGG